MKTITVERVEQFEFEVKDGVKVINKDDYLTLAHKTAPNVISIFSEDIDDVLEGTKSPEIEELWTEFYIDELTKIIKAYKIK